MTKQIPRALALALVVAAAILSTGCPYTDPLFCCTTEASCAAAGETEMFPCTDSTRPYCDDQGEYGVGRHCIPDPFATECDGPEDCTPERPLCINDMCVECSDNLDCDAEQPVCGAGNLCTDCAGNDDCEDHPGTPYCLTETGACVACVGAEGCSGTTPVCDQNSCRGCVAHAECSSDVCNTGTGECIDEANVLYLAPGGSGTTCTRAAPCGTFAAGLAQVSGSRNVIKAAPGTYSGQVSIDAETVTILADGATAVPGGLLPAVVVVTNGANASIRGLTIDGSAGGANGVGVNCGLSSTIDLAQSTVTGNGGGGVSLSDCAFTLVNNWIVGNGSSSTSFGGVGISTSAASRLEFNTIHLNNSNDSFPAGIACLGVTTPLTFSNNIVYGNESPDQVGGSMCSFTYSDIGPTTVSGTGNVNMDPRLVDPGNENLHLMSDSPCIDVADPAATLAVDIDGDARPQGDRADMGADEVVP